MPNFRPVERHLKFLAVDFEAQILPGTFEDAVSVLVDQELDLTAFIETYRNDDTSAPAYHPSILLKVILCGYSRGLISSRAIAAACRQHEQFIALCADSHPEFSTIAGFVSRHGEAIQSLFAQVLMICNREGLIGHEMFAIDGVKLPSNAAKSRSGLREDFEREAKKVEQCVEKMPAEHRRQDAARVEPEQEQREREVEKIERLRTHAKPIRTWLEKNPTERIGASGKPVLSNRTDNESAKMSTDKGVVQGYCGVVAVDEKHQIIVAAQAHGTTIVKAADTMLKSLGEPKDISGNGSERHHLRDVVRQAVALVEQHHGQHIPAAALQPLIWYPEQELYRGTGVKLKVMR